MHVRIYKDKLIAIKECHTSPQFSEKSLLKEISIMATLRHESILRVYGYNVETEADGGKVITILEDKAKTSLDHVLGELAMQDDGLSESVKRLRGEEKTYRRRKLYVLQIATGLLYVFRKKVCHGDLKLDNILVSEKGDLMISDFGMAKLVNADITMSTVKIGNKLQSCLGGGET